MQAAYSNRVQAFLQSKGIAVLGYSSSDKQAPANAIYDKLLKKGYAVYAVNPFQENFPKIKVYTLVENIPFPVEAAMLCTPPGETLKALTNCGERGIKLVWIHRSVDSGSYAEGVEAEAERWGISLLTFGCPMMFVQPDIAHRCMKWVFNLQGKLRIEG